MSENGAAALRLPPQSVEAEEAVLGGILLDNRALDRANEILTHDDFYRGVAPAHLPRAERSRRAPRARRRHHADRVLEAPRRPPRRSAALRRWQSSSSRIATAANVELYARIVKDKSILLSLMEAGTDIASTAAAGTGDVEQFLDDAERRIFEISERRIRPAFIRIEKIIVDSIKTIEALYERKEAVTGVPTGFFEIDRLTSGLQPADLIIIAGRPSMGKSALATNIAQHAASATAKPVAMFSLEMSKESLVLRMLCSEARVDSTRVRTGYLSEQDFPRLAMAAGRLADLPFYIDDSPALSVLELRAKARRLMRESGLGLIVVDYLQLMRSHKDVDNREQEISLVSRSLKALAKELNVPVVALSQLNRAVEQRADKRPLMADLRESGAIEQDADVIAFIYRDDFYNRVSPEEGIAEIIIAKQRNGPQGLAKLAFRKEFTLFENLSRRSDEAGGPDDYEG